MFVSRSWFPFRFRFGNNRNEIINPWIRSYLERLGRKSDGLVRSGRLRRFGAMPARESKRERDIRNEVDISSNVSTNAPGPEQTSNGCRM